NVSFVASKNKICSSIQSSFAISSNDACNSSKKSRPLKSITKATFCILLFVSFNNSKNFGISVGGKLSTQKYPKSSKLRSEEHTSELQSRFDLVCRLLLE